MTRGSRIGAKSLLAATLFLAVSVVAGSAALGQDGEVSTDPPLVLVILGNGASVGDELVIAGAGWEPSTLVEAAVCGNQGKIEAIDCVSLGVPFLTDADGSMVLAAVVPDPPTDCPCVVRVRPLDSSIGAFTSLEIAGADEIVEADVAEVVPTEETGAEPEPAPAVEPDPVAEPVVGAPLVVDVVSITGGGWRSWFGLANERSLEIVVRNPTDIDVDRPTLAVSWGRGADPRNLVEVPLLGRIVAGQTVALVADFTVSAPAFGEYEIYGIVGPVEGTTTFTSTFSTWPWGLFVVVAAVSFLALVWIWGRLRQRRGRIKREARQPAVPTLVEVLREELDDHLTTRLDRQAGETLGATERSAIAQEAGVELVAAVIARVDLTPHELGELADLAVGEIMAALEDLHPSVEVG